MKRSIIATLLIGLPLSLTAAPSQPPAQAPTQNTEQEANFAAPTLPPPPNFVVDDDDVMLGEIKIYDFSATEFSAWLNLPSGMIFIRYASSQPTALQAYSGNNTFLYSGESCSEVVGVKLESVLPVTNVIYQDSIAYAVEEETINAYKCELVDDTYLLTKVTGYRVKANYSLTNEYAEYRANLKLPLTIQFN